MDLMVCSNRFSHWGYRQKKHFISLLATVFILLLFPMFYVTQHNHLVSFATQQLSVSWEQNLGERAYRQFISDLEPIKNDEITQQLNQLTNQLSTNKIGLRQPAQFHLINQSDSTASALPGGYIVISSGFILSFNNARDFLGSLSHTNAHSQYQHALKNLTSSATNLSLIQTLWGDTSKLESSLIGSASILQTPSYLSAQKQEAEIFSRESLTENPIITMAQAG